MLRVKVAISAALAAGWRPSGSPRTGTATDGILSRTGDRYGTSMTSDRSAATGDAEVFVHGVRLVLRQRNSLPSARANYVDDA